MLRTARGTNAVQVRCDLSPTGQSWGFDAFPVMARLLGEQQPVERAGWLFTPDEVQVDGLEMEAEITVARSLVDVAIAGRFRPETVPAPAERSVSETPFPRHLRSERTDQ